MNQPYAQHTLDTLKVGYLGPGTGSFGYRAAQKLFCGLNVDFIPMTQHGEICRAVANGDLDHGCIAIENGIAGMVDESWRAIAKAALNQEKLYVQAETTLPIDLYLMANHSDPSKVKCIQSHDAALRQCGEFLNEYYSSIPLQSSNSTAAAAACARQSDSVAAIAGASAQQEHHLHLLYQLPIQDKPGNQTRFLQIGQHPSEIIPAGQRKTAILLANLNRDEPGSLQKALASFSNHGCGVSVIYPVPHPQRMWEYSFFCEFESKDDSSISNAIHDYQLRKLGDAPVRMGAYKNQTTAERLCIAQTTSQFNFA